MSPPGKVSVDSWVEKTQPAASIVSLEVNSVRARLRLSMLHRPLFTGCTCPLAACIGAFGFMQVLTRELFPYPRSSKLWSCSCTCRTSIAFAVVEHVIHEDAVDVSVA